MNLQNKNTWTGLGLSLMLLAACAAPPPTSTSSSAATTAPAAPATDVPTAAAESATPAEETAASIEGFPITLTDATGQSFTFDRPQKLGCYWYGCIEAFADLGIPVYAVALSPDEITSKFYSPAGAPTHLLTDDSNPEQWAAAEIDLFLTRVPPSDGMEPFKAVAPIFYLHHPSYGESPVKGYQAYIEDLKLIGQLTGQNEAAQAAIARFTNTLANLKTLSTPETAAQTVGIISSDSYNAVGPENPFCVALAEVRLGKCIGSGAKSVEYNAEAFLEINPDWIVHQKFDTGYADRKDPVWAQLKAVKAGHVYDAGTRYYCCSTRGLILSLQEFASHALPDAGIPAPGPQLDFDPTQSPLVVAP